MTPHWHLATKPLGFLAMLFSVLYLCRFTIVVLADRRALLARVGSAVGAFVSSLLAAAVAVLHG